MKLLVFDTETTGLPLHPEAPIELQPSIIEFGCALLDKGKVIKKFETLINPGKVLEPIITKITGITDEMLLDAPAFEVAWPKIKAMFDLSTGCIAHNEPFDAFLLGIELKRIGINFKLPAEFCTIGLYKSEYGYDMKLTELYEKVVGEKLAQTHRAMEDVNALVAIIQTGEVWRVLG